MKKTDLISPWYEYVNQVKALFGQDPAITINFDEDDMVLRIMVDGSAKAAGLAEILPEEVEFGKIILQVLVIRNNQSRTIGDYIRDAFYGNPAFCDTATTPPPYEAFYAIFKKEVVQYYNDDLGDIQGLRSTLYEDLAREVLSHGKVDGVYFCTATE